MKIISFMIISLFCNVVLVKNLISSQNGLGFVDNIKVTVLSTRVKRGNSSHIDVLRTIKASKTPKLRPVNINLNAIDMPETFML